MKKLVGFIKKNGISFILLLSAFLIFFDFTSGGLYGDDAIYSVRSIGPIDFMFANNQPTTLQLFDKVPWWASLSNHDHPPIVLWIQHIFLLFGNSIFFTRIHSALFGLLTIFVVYLIIKKRFGEKIALLSAFLLAINPYFIWFAKLAYLEMGVIFFLVLTLHFFIKFLEDRQFWLYFGLSLGVLLITKYTSFFILPAILFYLLIKERNIFRNKEIYLVGVVVLLVISPVIVYNVMMYNTLGHFDLQWSGVLGQESPWNLDKSITTNYLENLKIIGTVLGDSSSYLYVIFFIASIFYIIFKYSVFKLKKHEILPQERIVGVLFFTFIFLLIFFTFIVTPEARLMSIFTIFMAMFVGLFFGGLLTKNYTSKVTYVIYIIIFAFIGYQSFFSINSTVLNKPIGQENITYAKERVKDYGINHLDSYIDNLLEDKNVINKIDFYKVLKRKQDNLKRYKLENSYHYSSGEKFYPFIVWDPNINWFASVWLFEKRRFYYNLPVVSIKEFSDLMSGDMENSAFYFIKVADDGPLTSEKYRTDVSEDLEKAIIESGIEPELIYRKDGRVAFKIYKKL